LEGTLAESICNLSNRLFDLITRAEASLDFPEEGYHFIDKAAFIGEITNTMRSISTLLRDADAGRVLRDGATVVIAGRPNTGKSTLFNGLLRRPRAIVSETPGTTRDIVSESVDLNGVPVQLIDTAGIRPSIDAIEAEGVRRAESARQAANLVVVVLDGSQLFGEEDRYVLRSAENREAIVVVNKCDLPQMLEAPAGSGWIRISALRDDGLDCLRTAIVSRLGARESLVDAPRVTNIRHIDLLRRAELALTRAAQQVEAGAPEEIVLLDLNEARDALEEVSGRRTSDDVLEHIFARFCIGK
jgi:tRNA modification GTPase